MNKKLLIEKMWQIYVQLQNFKENKMTNKDFFQALEEIETTKKLQKINYSLKHQSLK